LTTRYRDDACAGFGLVIVFAWQKMVRYSAQR
jgi:hypothetical protein